MTENQKYLNEAQTRIKKFEVELEPERLREAYMALENVSLVQEHNPIARARLRTNALFSWLHLLHTLDRFLDPRFNPDDVPENLVQPPPTSEGIVYPPGADPALIEDAKARAEYEQAIAANRAKANHYRLQVRFRRLEERIAPRTESFIRTSYTTAPRDQEELKTAINKTITDPKRKTTLLKLVASPQP